MAFADQLDKIKEQEWFQQLKSSFDQLPAEQQEYVKWGSFAAGVFALIYLTFSTVELAATAKNDYYDKQELSEVVNQASDEIRRLKGQNAGFAQNSAQNWKMILQNLATQTQIPPESIELLKEAPGATQSIILETLLEINIKAVNTRQLTTLLYQMEHGNPPMKVKGMKITTNQEDGTLSAHINVSGYLPKPEKDKGDRK
jgi:malate/lactate dehydrogenase